jgi:hypothetical protein
MFTPLLSHLLDGRIAARNLGVRRELRRRIGYPVGASIFGMRDSALVDEQVSLGVIDKPFLAGLLCLGFWERKERKW